jgi:hypothetical protein
MNLVDMLLKLSGGNVGKSLAGVLGEGEERTESAIQSAVPALLAALSGLAANREGANRLASAVASADDGILGNLGSVVAGQGSSLAQSGASVLGSLFGGSELGDLGSILGKFTGMKTGSIVSLLGALAPIVLGLLKRETKGAGSDPAALTRLLASQKDNIASALPSGLSSMLGSIPGLEQFSRFAESTRATAGQAAGRVAATGREAQAAAAEGLGAMKWVVPLLILLGLGYFAWNYFAPKNNAPEVVTREPAATTSGVDAPTRVTAAKITPEIARQTSEITLRVKDVFSEATTALTDVTDEATAEDAVPKITDLTGKLGEVKATFDQLPEAQREPIVQSINQLRGPLTKLIDKILTIPGVSAILRTPIEELQKALAAFET